MTKARAARVDLTLSKAGFDRGIAGSRRELRGFARDGRKQLGDLNDYGKRSTFGRDMLGKLGRGAQIGGLKAAKYGLIGVAGAAAVGGVGLLSMADDVFNLERSLTRFQIATDMSDASLAEFRSGLSEVSTSTGVNRQELLNGAAAYVALTGDAAGATKGMELFGRVSNATGASMADIAATAAALKDNLGIDIAKDGEAAFSALAVQGKAGAVELRDLAQYMSDLSPAMAGFAGGKGLQGLIEMGAVLQVVKKDAGTAGKASTNMISLANSFVRNAKKFKKKGIHIYDRKGEKRNYLAIINDIRNAKMSDTQLIDLVGSTEALAALKAQLTRAALTSDLVTAGSDRGAIARDAAKFEASDAGRIAKAWEGAKLKMAELFTPERIEAFVGALETATLALADFITWLTPNSGFVVDQRQLSKIAGIEAAATGNAVRTFDPKGFGSGDPLKEWHNLGQAVMWQSRAMQTAATTPNAAPSGRAPLGLGAALNIVLKVDGNEVARASANANEHRTRPGGI